MVINVHINTENDETPSIDQIVSETTASSSAPMVVKNAKDAAKASNINESEEPDDRKEEASTQALHARRTTAKRQVKNVLGDRFQDQNDTSKRKSLQVKESNSYNRQRQIEEYKAMTTREDRKRRYRLRQLKEYHSPDSKVDYPSNESARNSDNACRGFKLKKEKRVTFRI